MTSPDPLLDDEAVCEQATAGPWYFSRSSLSDTIWHDLPTGGMGRVVVLPVPSSAEADGAFIARARTRYPELVREVRELRDRLATLEQEKAQWIDLQEKTFQASINQRDRATQAEATVGRLTALAHKIGIFLEAGIKKAEQAWIPGWLSNEYESVVDAWLALPVEERGKAALSSPAGREEVE